MSFLRSWLNSLSGNGTNIVVYIAIVILFLVGIIMCVVPVMDTKRRLHIGTRDLRRKNRRKNWQEETFLGNGALFEQWCAYLKNLRFSDGVYHAAAAVDDFINEETVIYGPGRAAFSDALPGLLTSLGFLGTLVGLSQGLSGFDMTDASTAQQSILVLIPGMRYAFLTSIFGVVGSVLFTLVRQMVYGSAGHAIREFYAALNQYTGVHSVDALTQMATYQQEQTDILRTMAMDVNGRLTDNLRGIITEAMEPMTTAMNDFMTVTSKEQMRFLDAIAGRFVDRMNVALNGQLDTLSESITRTTKAQTEAMDALRDSLRDAQGFMTDIRSLRNVYDELTGSLNNYLTQLTASRAKADDSFRHVSSAVEQMDIIARQQNQYLKTVSAMNGEVSQAVEKMTGAVSALYERMVDENESSAQVLRDTIKSLRQMSGELTELQKQSMHIVETEVNATLKEYSSCAADITGSVRRINESVSKLPTAVDGACDRFAEELDKMGKTLEDAQRSLDDAVDKLYGMTNG